MLSQVAGKLGDTVAVCRKSYVHPLLLTAAFEGDPARLLSVAAQQLRPRGLLPAERQQLLCLLAGVCAC